MKDCFLLHPKRHYLPSKSSLTSAEHGFSAADRGSMPNTPLPKSNAPGKSCAGPTTRDRSPTGRKATRRWEAAAKTGRTPQTVPGNPVTDEPKSGLQEALQKTRNESKDTDDPRLRKSILGRSCISPTARSHQDKRRTQFAENRRRPVRCRPGKSIPSSPRIDLAALSRTAK
jgi:hypothetical protein